jgi:hypothetical protein
MESRSRMCMGSSLNEARRECVTLPEPRAKGCNEGSSDILVISIKKGKGLKIMSLV